MNARALSRLAAPLRRAINLMVGRALVTMVNDALKMQGVQVELLADEVRDNVERFQEYGFTSHPHAGAEALVVAVGGNRNHAVVIKCEDRRYRLTGLADGEVAIYDDLGTKIVLKRGNEIEVTAATKVHIVSALVEMSGDAKILGKLDVTGKITGTAGLAVSGGTGMAVTGGSISHDGVNIGKTHVHSGVQPGAGDSGAPH